MMGVIGLLVVVAVTVLAMLFLPVTAGTWCDAALVLNTYCLRQ